MTTVAPPLTPGEGTAPSRHPSRVIVISAGGSSHIVPTSLPTTRSGGPAAVIVIANDGDAHPELWPQPAIPVLVVLPPHAPPAVVVAAFRAGADSCVSTASTAEVTAHLGALLRRHSLQGARA